MNEEELNEKWSVHKIIQEAINSAHTNPSPYTIKMFDEIKGDIKEMKNDTKDVLIQATKTNGRVSRGEEWSKKAQKIIEHNTEAIEELKDSLGLINAAHKSGKKQIIMAVTIATFFIGTVVTLGYKVLQQGVDNRIDVAVEKSLSERVNKVEYEK